MTIFTIVVAMNKDRVIGVDGMIPWDIKSDRTHFKNLTIGFPVIMGRRTFDEILERTGKPLPQRQNIVLTRNKEEVIRIQNLGGTVCSSIDEARALVANQPKAAIIGGAQVYLETLEFADAIEFTHVQMRTPGGQLTKFPKFEKDQWARRGDFSPFKKRGPWDSHYTRYESLARIKEHVV